VRKFALAMALAVAASLMLAGGAFARDRNHDRIPDKWEKRHHLSLKHKQARRDQDHDGLKNRGEFRAHLDPRDADTDDDGVDDGDEHPGTVKSFENGVLTISLANGGAVSGAVTDDTEVECDDDPGDDRGHDEGDDRHDGDGDHGDDDDAMAADDDPGDDDHEDGEECGTDALVAGAKVLEAELEIRNGEAVWEEIELLATP
jgi:hypothetical protein